MKTQKLELRVGIFVLTGLLALGFMIVTFGRFGELFQKSYDLTVEFSNTSGVIKNSQVLYRGARVGTVSTAPFIADGGSRVDLGLKINRDIMIDKKSRFQVSSYGLLGDRFIDIQPPVKPSGEYFQDGDRVQGSLSVGFGDLTEKLEPVVAQLQRVAAQLEEEEVIENLGASMTSIRGITAKMDRILDQAEKGEGAVYTLLNDKKTAEELKKTISEFKILAENLRKRGILFYRDLSADEKKK
ncbi:MAG: MlaD family protein [Candidatus Methylacidiphilales bacterium]